MKKLLTIVVLLASFNVVSAQTVSPANAPLRKDGITVKRMESTDKVAVVDVKKKTSFFNRKNRKYKKSQFRVTICPGF